MTKPASAKNPVPQMSVASIAREATGLIEIPKLALEPRSLRDEPRGSGLPVRVFSGFSAGDQSTWPLRRFLNLQGHRAKGWGLGSNIRDVPDTVEPLGELTQKRAERSGGPVFLVGWSLEGYIAREVAGDYPNSVRRVVTFGSPPSRAGFQRRRVSRRCAALGGG